MDLMKLNKCLLEMDSISGVFLDYENVAAKIKFNCFNGGQYEDVELSVILNDPIYFHLPFVLSGSFQLLECTSTELRELVKEEFYEDSLRALRIVADEQHTNFYCCFSDIEWALSDGAQVINKHELRESI